MSLIDQGIPHAGSPHPGGGEAWEQGLAFQQTTRQEC